MRCVRKCLDKFEVYNYRMCRRDERYVKAVKFDVQLLLHDDMCVQWLGHFPYAHESARNVWWGDV